jgi:hypothetical protein
MVEGGTVSTEDFDFALICGIYGYSSQLRILAV